MIVAAPDMLALLHQAMPLLVAHYKQSGEGALTIDGIRQVMKKIADRI